MPNWLLRVLVSLAGIPLVLGMLWLGGWWLFALLAVAAILSLHEFYGMTRELRPLVLAGYAGVIAALLGAHLGGVEWLVGGFLLTFVLGFFFFLVATTRAPATVAISGTVLGAAWIGFGLACVLLLRGIPEHGRLAVFTVVIAVWADDTAAYLVGRLVGRHKFSPALSPAKTWEGFVAGTIVAIATAFFCLYDTRKTFLSIWEAVLLGGVIAIAAALGDLFESALKRDMHVKDSGRILPGHGGILDRVDALLFAVPAVYFTIVAVT
jgi:phosphatidate cytidylyltransferase